MPSWWFNYSWEGRHSTRNYLIKLWYSTTKKGGVQREHLTKRADQVKDIKESVIWREKNRRGKGVRKTHFWCLGPHWLKGHKTERNTGFWRLAISTEMDWEGVWQKSWWGRQGSQQWKPCKLKIWFFFFFIPRAMWSHWRRILSRKERKRLLHLLRKIIPVTRRR